MIHIISKYFERTQNYTVKRFIVEMYFLAIFTKVVLIFLILLLSMISLEFEIFLFGHSEQVNSQFENYNWASGLFIACILLPFMESIVGQGLPILVMSLLIKNKIILVLFSSIWFTFLHSIAFDGFAFAILILFAGFIYAWSFLVYKSEGFWKAVTVTTFVHSLYNLTIYFTYFFSP